MNSIRLTEFVVGVILQEVQLLVNLLGDSSNERQVEDEAGDIPDIVCLLIVQMDCLMIVQMDGETPKQDATADVPDLVCCFMTNHNSYHWLSALHLSS